MHVPQLPDLSLAAVISAFWALTPKIVSFAVSFFTVAIYWVNHHHFFNRVTHTDWKLLWANNLLLFWLTIVPFTTAFIGDYPSQPLVVAIYSLVLALAGGSFALMGYYVFFKSGLLLDSVPQAERQREFNRALFGTGLYVVAAVLAFIFVYAALALLTVIPFLFVVPNLMRQEG